jgi:hypothetical protein
MASNRAASGSIGEWHHSPPSGRRTSVMRVGNGALRPSGAAMRTIGPSTIHSSGATGLSVLMGW